MSEMRKALTDVLSDIAEYERINNLAPNPGKPDCWASVTRARAALAEPEWRDMASAPKDGTPVLLLFADGTMEVGKNFDNDTGWWTNDGLDFGYGFDVPTHWRLPPSPPEALAEKRILIGDNAYHLTCGPAPVEPAGLALPAGLAALKTGGGDG